MNSVVAFLIATLVIVLLNINKEELQRSELSMKSLEENANREHIKKKNRVSFPVEERKTKKVYINKEHVNNWRKLHGMPMKRRYLP